MTKTMNEQMEDKENMIKATMSFFDSVDIESKLKIIYCKLFDIEERLK